MTLPGTSGVVLRLKAEKRSRAGWPGLTWSMSAGRDPHLDGELGAPRGTMVASRAGGRDDAADGEDGHLVDGAGDGRADVGARQPVLVGDAAVLQFGQLRLDLAQLALRLGAGRVVDRDDLQAGLADAQLGPCEARIDLAALAEQPCPFAVDVEDLDAVDVALLEQAEIFAALQFDEPAAPRTWRRDAIPGP